MRSVSTAQHGSRCRCWPGQSLLLALALLSLPLLAKAQTLPWKPNALIRFWGLHVNPLEFRDPLRLAPFDVKAGLAAYDQSGVIFDSTESEITTIASISARLMLVYDLDLVKVNLVHRFVPFSLLDVLVGVGLRTNQVPLARGLPAEWPPSDQDYRFAPVFRQALLNLTIGYQRSERWYSYVQITRGLAVGNVYRAGVTGRYLGGSGTSSDLALGLKWFRATVGNARYNLGLELRYHGLNVPKLDDPDRASPEADEGISPVEGLQLRSLGLFLTFGISFGGRATAADRAKRDLYRGDYMSAESNLRSFLQRFPRHGKTGRAQKMLALVETLVPYQQLELAQAAQEAGRLEEALLWLDRAETRADTNLTGRISDGRADIGYIYLQQADSLLRMGQLGRTDNILRAAEVLLPLNEDIVDRYDAEVLIRQGHDLRAGGDLTAALRRYDLAAEADTSRRVEIDGYKVRVAEDLLKEAEFAADRSAFGLALESLRLSQALDPRRKAELDLMIVDLEAHIAKTVQGEIRRSIEAQLQEARALRNRVPPSKPRLGLLVAQIEALLGLPDHVARDTDRLGIDHQLWEYRGGEHPGMYYFEEYVLKRMEPPPERSGE